MYICIIFFYVCVGQRAELLIREKNGRRIMARMASALPRITTVSPRDCRHRSTARQHAADHRR